MQWRGRRQSANVDDRRRIGTGRLAVGGGIGTIIIILLGIFLGVDPGNMFGGSGPGVSPGGPTTTITLTADQQQMGDFASVILADTEDYWTQQFQAVGHSYEQPKMVLFTGSVNTASGYATSAVGPFYSPPDKTVYIDLSFFQDLESRYGAGGDYTWAYVIAHEVGHHVQNLLGVLSQVDAERARVSEAQANELSVRLELQADFYAGCFTKFEQSQGYLETGDVNEALNAASAIGDDRLQREAQGYVVKDSFTHGTSEQRSRWFDLGYTTGDISRGDTFSPAYDAL